MTEDHAFSVQFGGGPPFINNSNIPIMPLHNAHFGWVFYAHVVKLANTPDLGSGAERFVGSSPTMGTIFKRILYEENQTSKEVDETT